MKKKYRAPKTIDTAEKIDAAFVHGLLERVGKLRNYCRKFIDEVKKIMELRTLNYFYALANGGRNFFCKSSFRH